MIERVRRFVKLQQWARWMARDEADSVGCGVPRKVDQLEGPEVLLLAADLVNLAIADHTELDDEAFVEARKVLDDALDAMASRAGQPAEKPTLTDRGPLFSGG